jgi:hypothetical protein
LKIKYALFVVLAYFPVAIIAFILGGIDAVLGTGFVSRFFNSIEKMTQRLLV